MRGVWFLCTLADHSTNANQCLERAGSGMNSAYCGRYKCNLRRQFSSHCPQPAGTIPLRETKRMPLCTDILPYSTFDLHGADRKQTRTQP